MEEKHKDNFDSTFARVHLLHDNEGSATTNNIFESNGSNGMRKDLYLENPLIYRSS